MIVEIPEWLISGSVLGAYIVLSLTVFLILLICISFGIERYYRRVMKQAGVRGVIQFGKEYREWKRGVENVKPLTFSEYETIVDINNHNYARWEALIEHGHIKAGKLNET